MSTRWSCGPMAAGDEAGGFFYGFSVEDCRLEFSLNYYRYVRQIKLGERVPHGVFLLGHDCSCRGAL